MTARPVRPALAAEDIVLAAWNAIGVPLVALGGATTLLQLGDAVDPVAGVIQFLAVLGAIVAVGTRPSGGASLPAEGFTLRVMLIGPFIGAVAFVSGSASAYLGLNLDMLLVGLAFVAIVAAMAFGERLPTLPAALRRWLLAPFILVCAGIFDGLAADLLEGLDVGELVTALSVDQTGFGLFVIGLLLGGLGAFYAALIVAPRMIVDPQPGPGWVAWPIRFVLFIVSALFGIGWLTLVG